MDDDPTVTPVVPSDRELLAALSVVLRQDEAVPADAVEAAIEAFTWQAVDAELLQLLYDSAVDQLTPTRASESPSRLLTFTSPSVDIEIELSAETPVRVRGAVTPVGSYTVELQQGSSRVGVVSSESGLFELAALDRRPLRLIITTVVTGARLVTPWIELADR